MREFAHAFYHSTSWKITRKAYMQSVGGLCELCLENGIYRPAAIVHHKVWLNPKNINNPEITLSWDNLMAVCREHHERIHDHERFVPVHERNRRYEIGADGSVSIKNDPPGG